MDDRPSSPARVEALLEIRRFQDAISEASRLVGSEPSFENRILLVRALYSGGYYPQAWNEVRSARALRPENAYACRLESIVRSALGHESDARKLAKQAVRLDPMSPENFALLSELELAQSRVLRARSLAERALVLAPTHRAARVALGRANLGMGNLHDAEIVFRQLLAEDPSDADALDNLALVLARRGELASAMALFRDAVVSEPTVERHRLYAGRAANRRTAFPYVVALGAVIGGVGGVIGLIVGMSVAAILITTIDARRVARGKSPWLMARRLREQAGVGSAVIDYRKHVLARRGLDGQHMVGPEIFGLAGLLVVAIAFLTRLADAPVGVQLAIAFPGLALIIVSVAMSRRFRRPVEPLR